MIFSLGIPGDIGLNGDKKFVEVLDKLIFPREGLCSPFLPCFFSKADREQAAQSNPGQNWLATLGPRGAVLACGSVLLSGAVLHVCQRASSTAWGPFPRVDFLHGFKATRNYALV